MVSKVHFKSKNVSCYQINLRMAIQVNVENADPEVRFPRFKLNSTTY